MFKEVRNSQIKHMLRNVLLDLRDSGDDILKRFSMMELRKMASHPINSIDDQDAALIKFSKQNPDPETVYRINAK